MQGNSVCLFLPKLLINNEMCKHLSHGPGPAGRGASIGQTGSHFAALHISLFRRGEWAEAFKQNVFRGFRVEDFMFANDLQVHTHKPPPPLIKRLVEAQTSSAAQPL